jgi:hypothetical protein
VTAIRATFSQYAMVKTRGVLVLHMEVPLEQQAEVFKVLGYPLPGEEVWCGIARLNSPDTRKEVIPRPLEPPQTHNATPPETGAVAPLTVCQKCGGSGGEYPTCTICGTVKIVRHVSLPDDATSEDVGRAFAGLTASERGKARYASANDMERARTRAALLPKDARFQSWALDQWGSEEDLSGEDTVARHIRDICCAGESRKLIAEDKTCYRAFIAMETQYLVDTNQMAEPR